MIDVAAYALLKRGISTSGVSSSQITDAKIENEHLILILSDGSTIDCGTLPAAGIDDATTSPDTTWSSNKIVDYVENNVIPPQYDLIHGGQAQEINVSNN